MSRGPRRLQRWLLRQLALARGGSSSCQQLRGSLLEQPDPVCHVDSLLRALRGLERVGFVRLRFAPNRTRPAILSVAITPAGRAYVERIGKLEHAPVSTGTELVRELAS